MNKEHIGRAIELLQSLKYGARIEIRDQHKDHSEWETIIFPKQSFQFYFSNFDYRAVYPKLTEDVFKRDDCPAWAKWAGVSDNGTAYFYEKKPDKIAFGCYQAETLRVNSIIKYIKFDATDWQNSLVERPTEVKMPDWCKIGAKVFVDDKLVEIISIDENKVLVDTNYIPEVFTIDNISPAVYVLPTIDEIFQRSNLVVKCKETGQYKAIIDSDMKGDVLFHNGIISIASLDHYFTWADGTPIGKWVKGKK